MDEKDTDAELDLYIAMQMTLQDKIQGKYLMNSASN